MKTKSYNIIGKREIVIVLITLVIGLTLGYFLFGNSTTQTAIANEHTFEEHAKETIWTCSMHPQIRQNEPGNCPICGMDLIPLADAGTEEVSDPNEIQMSESAMKLAEVQTFIVESGVPEKIIYLLGKVQADERNIATLTARFGGRIEKLFVNYTGQYVKKGQKLASIYSPDLITAQKELIEALKYKETNPSFYKATRSKLKLWELTEKQIDIIENQGEPIISFDILSPISGTVTRRDVSLGDYVKEGTPLFEVIDLTRVWVMFDAYESDLPWVNMGDTIKFTLQSIPGAEFDGTVSYIDPFINAKTRVAQVRVVVNNKNMKLKPEMFANGMLLSHIAKNTNELLIPKTSVLWTGKRAVVYVKIPNSKTPSFIYREIVLGPESGNYYVVADGLTEGEEVASNGVFKIDASAQLAGKPSMMNPEGGKVSTGHNHGGTTMTDEEMENMDVDNSSDNEMVSYQNEVSAMAKSQLGNLVESYLIMKDAFVATDENEVVKQAEITLVALNKVDMKGFKDDAHLAWMKIQKNIKDNLLGIINMKGIEMKRSHFSVVSNEITKAIEMFGINTESTVYLEYCPMAFDYEGAYWVSNNKEIRNPYFGDKMLKCGEVKKTLN